MKAAFILISSIFFLGCINPSLKISNSRVDEAPLSIFGGNSERNFSTLAELGDSLVKVWENQMNGTFTNTSVVIYNDVIFSNDLSGRIYAFNINSGKRIAYTKFDGPVYSTPVINNFNLLLTSVQRKNNNSKFIVYDYFSGKILKSTTVAGRALTQIAASENHFFFTTQQGIVYKFDSAGEKIWEVDTGTPTNSSPALSGNKLLFGNDKGELLAVDTDDGEIVLRKKLGVTFYGGTVVKDSAVLIGNDKGKLFSVNVNDGNINWEFDTGSRIIMHPSSDETNIFIGNLRGDLFSLNLINGEKNWESRTGGLLNTAPLVSYKYIFQPDVYNRLLIIDKSSGEIVSTLNVEGRMKLTPVYEKGLLLIGYDNGVLAAYEVY
jgi:outer membrane protein assembly factor BamB